MTDLHHLNGVVNNLEPTSAGKGLCFHRSAALVFDLGDEALLTIGVVRAATAAELEREPNASKVPFFHCWVELKGQVLAPTLAEKMGGIAPIDRDRYYQANGVRDVRQLTRRQILKAARGSCLASHLRYGHPLMGGRPLGDILLQAAGIEYGVTASGTVVPKGSPEAVS